METLLLSRLRFLSAYLLRNQRLPWWSLRLMSYAGNHVRSREASLFSTGLTIVSFRLMLYAVLMKCLDILAQYLIMLGIYIATRQVTIGFLVLVAGNLLCIIPGNWVAYSPFGLSSLTRISVVEPGIGISAVSAFGIEAAILTLMIAGILMWGYKKILN